MLRYQVLEHQVFGLERTWCLGTKFLGLKLFFYLLVLNLGVCPKKSGTKAPSFMVRKNLVLNLVLGAFY